MSETSTSTKKSSKSGNRYSGVDAQPWQVWTASGSNKRIGGGQETFASFKLADGAAKQFTDATGEYASAVRA